MEYQIRELKNIIAEHEITQKELAEESKIDKTQLNKILTGKINTTLKTFNKITDAVINISMK
jgi:predicted transcriptional regulator